MQAGDGVISKPDMLPVNLLIYAIEVARQHGCDVDPYLQRVGLANVDRQASLVEIPRQQYYEFIELLFVYCSVPAFGFMVGQRFSLADYGVLGYAFISSSTLGQSLQTFFRFQQIVGSDSSFSEELRRESGYAVIRINCLQTDELIYRFEVEEAVGQWSVSNVVLEDGSTLAFSKVHFSFPKPKYSLILEQRLQCPVYYDKEASEIFIEEALLNQRFNMANEVTAQLCEQQCEKVLLGLKNQGGLTEHVRRLIISRPGEVVEPGEIASSLNMSYRTLRRRLREENHSFKDIYNEVRMGMAMEYLGQTELSIQEIAFLLGYSEVTNFHRAFKKWQQKTPGEYRQSVQYE
jgi:AraC-like DNA-binding protein